MGIIGFGRIGQAEGRIAKALGMNVIAYDLYPNESGRAIADYVTQDELFAKADVISLHCNLTPENAVQSQNYPYHDVSFHQES